MHCLFLLMTKNTKRIEYLTYINSILFIIVMSGNFLQQIKLKIWTVCKNVYIGNYNIVFIFKLRGDL